MNINAVENVKGNGFMTSYYFISAIDDTFTDLVDRYISNPMSKEDISEFFEENPINSDGVKIAVEFYMSQENLDPDDEIYEDIYKDLEEMDHIPQGEYFISLHDNYVMTEVASGKKIQLEKLYGMVFKNNDCDDISRLRHKCGLNIGLNAISDNDLLYKVNL